MNRQEYIQKSGTYLGRLVHEIKTQNAIGLFDINTVAEDFFVPILSVLYGCNDLKNQNQIKTNFPSVDLGCRTSRISFQVTSDPSSGKIEKTLRKFCEHSLEKDFDTVYILIITEKYNTYSSKALEEQIKKMPIVFSKEKHVIDTNDLAKKIGEATTEDVEKIFSLLEAEFRSKDSHLKFREDLEKFLEFGQRKIEVEKNTKKYIPSIFIETSSAKDAMRLFSNPLFFSEKIDDCIERIKFTRLNKWICLAGEKEIENSLDCVRGLSAPTCFDELFSKMELQRQALVELERKLNPYTWRGADASSFTRTNEDVWDIFKYKVGGHGGNLADLCGEAISYINLINAKIFLVTGMAGQGKTNFVCDLVEKQFNLFEIPSVFIPARELNNYYSSSRIFSFITNSRYSPKVLNLHELLEVFNSIAKENNKPFVIAIDGINEVTALSDFNGELTSFLEAVCQYDFIKVVLTCRSEFFDQRYASILDEQFSKYIHRIRDLRSEMSEENKDRLLEAYFAHFSIELKLSNSAAEFLMNDLLLLRIFCELNEGQSEGSVYAIYKGDLFEAYLKKKVSEFPSETRKFVLPTLHKIARKMIECDAYTKLSTREFSEEETGIVLKMVAEDIILRREVPDTDLSALGDENISFTYDDLRDFIIAHYLSTIAIGPEISSVKQLFKRLAKLPIYEGVYRYTYIAARKAINDDLLQLCEEDPNFLRHYIRNLPLLASELQNDGDVDRILKFMSETTDRRALRRLAAFLFGKRNDSEIIHIRILVQYVNSLPSVECRALFEAIFSQDNDYGHDKWREHIGAAINSWLPKPNGGPLELDVGLLAFLLQIAGYADWTAKEEFQRRFSKRIHEPNALRAIDVVRQAKSTKIRQNIDEITTPTEAG